MMKDARRHSRIPYTGPITISWDDGREVRYTRGRCIDVAEGGLRIEVPQSIPQGTAISLRAERIRISGAARVCHTTRYGARYLIGVQLGQGMESAALAALSDPQNLRAPAVV